MAGHILVIDTDASRRAALSEALASGYLVTETCASTDHAMKAARKSAPGLILAEGGPGGAQGVALCSSLKSDPDLAATPVVVMLDADDHSGRIGVLKAGADDLLIRPIDTRVLLARIRSLIRIRAMSDELMLRQATARELGLDLDAGGSEVSAEPHLLIIGENRSEAEAFGDMLRAGLPSRLTIAKAGFGALRAVETDPPDAVLVMDPAQPVDAGGYGGFAEPSPSDPVQFVGILRGRAEIRHAPILMLSAAAADPRWIAAALDAGATDCASLDDMPEELTARLSAQLRRRHFSDRLRAMLDDGMRKAITDPLTDLPGRRYLEPHLDRLFTQAQTEDRPLAVLLFDLDRFKQVNDTFGHAAGDAAILMFADRLRAGIRAADLAVRYGGEEFLVLAPDTDVDAAAAQAARICKALAHEPLILGPERTVVPLTVSAGIAAINAEDHSPKDLIARADQALGMAKAEGRNRVRVALATVRRCVG